MFQQLDIGDGRILALRITAEVSEHEHHLLDRLIRHYINQWRQIRILVVIDHYPSLSSAEALYEDLRMIKLHADHIDRLAVASDHLQDRTYLGLFGLFGKLQTDYFALGELDRARQWLNESIAIVDAGNPGHP